MKTIKVDLILEVPDYGNQLALKTLIESIMSENRELMAAGAKLKSVSVEENGIRGEESGELFSQTEMSINEKDFMCRLMQKSPQLEYPLSRLETKAHDDELVYDIPEDKLMDEINRCWPFDGEAIKKDTLFIDVHSDMDVHGSELRIIRSHDRNMVVSPHFSESGGMAIDLVPPDSDGIYQAVIKQ